MFEVKNKHLSGDNAQTKWNEMELIEAVAFKAIYTYVYVVAWQKPWTRHWQTWLERQGSFLKLFIFMCGQTYTSIGIRQHRCFLCISKQKYWPQKNGKVKMVYKQKTWPAKITTKYKMYVRAFCRSDDNNAKYHSRPIATAALDPIRHLQVRARNLFSNLAESISFWTMQR